MHFWVSLMFTLTTRVFFPAQIAAADGEMWNMDEWYNLFTGDEPEVDRANKLREITKASYEPVFADPDVVAKVEKCNHSKFVVPPSHGNDFAVPVLVHTPKRIGESNY